MVGVELKRDELVGRRWKVVRKVAEGGFGAVYQTIDTKTNQECAVKIEPSNQDSVLKMEAYVLMKLRGYSHHACGFLGCGRQGGQINFLVMDLVGRSLADLHRSRPERRFSAPTVARLAVQCIDALQELHAIGFVHRDVKPGNLAMGRREADRRTVFLLDFGLARRIVDPSNDKGGGEIRKARASAGFRGTVRYASVNVHEGVEQGRHDDLLSLVYVLIEFRRGRLAWADVDDDEEVARIKKTMPNAELLKDLDPEYAEIYDRLCKTQYEHTPNYAWMAGRIVALQRQKKFPEDGPFEWE